MTDHELLNRYAEGKSEEAFGELVRRHVDWVYSACRRQVGDAGLAEDVTQAVFLTLARKGSGLSSSVSISGWLFTTARYASATALKIERRRQKHERQAASMINETRMPESESAWATMEPQLDRALGKLSASDREAIILRFFRGMSHEAIGESLAITTVAAQKRVNRAVGRLRAKLGVGAALSVGAMGMLLGERSTQAAPVEMTTKSLAALKGGVHGRTELIVKGVSAMKKAYAIKVGAAVAAAVLAGAATTFALSAGHHGAAVAPVVAVSAAVGHVPAFDVSGVKIIRGTTRVNGGVLVTLYLNRPEVATVEQVGAFGWSATHVKLQGSEWDYRDGGKLILQKRPQQDAAAQLKDLDAHLDEVRKSPAMREAASDLAVDGVTWEAYRLLPGSIDVQAGEAAGTLPTEGPLVFVHPETHRPMRIQAKNMDVTLAYDPEVPAGFFSVPQIAGATTVKALEYLEKRYPVEGAGGAVFTRKTLGSVFAVHEAVMDAAGCYHIVCSSRPNAEVRGTLKDLPDDQALTRFMMDTRAKLPFEYIKVGEVRESGMQVSYVVAVPKKDLVAEGLCELPVTMGGANEVLDAAGLPYGEHSGHDTHVMVRLNVEKKEGVETAAAFAGRAYDDVGALVGLTPETYVVGPRRDSGLSTREESVREFERQLAEAVEKAAPTP